PARHPPRRRRREAGAGRDPRGPEPLHDARASAPEIAGAGRLVAVRAAGRRGGGGPPRRGALGDQEGEAGHRAGEYRVVMKEVRKVAPPKREILGGIWLSFFDGAKMGVLGANGAGKSSLLRIMAGVDRDFLGEAFPAANLRIGHLPQEPQLDPAKDVRGNVE